MDRDKRWDRVEAAYNNMLIAEGKRYATAKEAIEASYAAKVTDEFVISLRYRRLSGHGRRATPF